jgi:hypothetical protein
MVRRRLHGYSPRYEFDEDEAEWDGVKAGLPVLRAIRLTIV